MMSLETVQTDAEGYLANRDDWSEELAREYATQMGIELTDEHWAPQDQQALGNTDQVHLQTLPGWSGEARREDRRDPQTQVMPVTKQLRRNQ
jgi:hypothetical protein